MTGTELKTAFINRLPVITSFPGQPQRSYRYIYRIIYCHQLGTSKPAVEVEIVSENGSKHRESVTNVFIASGVKSSETLAGLDFQIPPKIKELFIKRASVMVNEYPERRYEEINELELTRFPDSIELRCLFYNRQYVAGKLDKPRRVYPDSIVENFSKHPEFYYDLLDRNEYERENPEESKAYQAFRNANLVKAKQEFHNFTESLRRQVEEQEKPHLELVK